MSALDQPVECTKKIFSLGTGLSVYLPNIAKEYGFDSGTEVSVQVTQNKIILTPLHSQEYKSVLKRLIKKQNKLYPVLQKDSTSPRYEDLEIYKINDNIIILTQDHHKDQIILLLYEEKTKKWTARYITQTVYEEIKQGKHPQNFIVIE